MISEQSIQYSVTLVEPMISVRACEELLDQMLEPWMVKHLGNMERITDSVKTYPQNHSPIVPK